MTKNQFDWRKHLPVHPVADEFPMLPDDELQELAEDIKVHGLRSGLTLWQSDDESEAALIDGRNRCEAMAVSGQLGVNGDGYLCRRVLIGGEWSLRPIHYNFRKGDPYALVASLTTGDISVSIGGVL